MQMSFTNADYLLPSRLLGRSNSQRTTCRRTEKVQMILFKLLACIYIIIIYYYFVKHQYCASNYTRHRKRCGSCHREFTTSGPGPAKGSAHIDPIALHGILLNSPRLHMDRGLNNTNNIKCSGKPRSSILVPQLLSLTTHIII